MEVSLNDTLGRIGGALGGAADVRFVAELSARAARLLIDRGDLDGAAQLLEQAPAGRSAALDEASVALARARARQLQRQKRWSDAIEVWRTVVQIAPQDSAAHMGLALSLEKTRQPEAALQAYLALIEAAPTMTNYLTVAQRVDALTPALPERAPNRVVRVALLGNATLDHLRSYMTVECFRSGLRPTMYHSGFDQYNQEILDPNSGLYDFAPDVVVCAIHATRLFPGLHSYPFDMSIDARKAELAVGVDTVRHLLETLTARTSALVLLHNMVSPQHPALGILDLRDEFGQTAAFAEINVRLAEMVRSGYPGVYIVDEDRLQARCGKAHATDPRLWLTGRLPWGEAVLAALSQEYVRYIRPLRGLNRKCIVLDLDNTLWGGVVGEDGAHGLQLGSDAPGNAFVALQSELERLWRRGILLAICSKNNPDEALAAIDGHPDMVLRQSHFSAIRINWESKAVNLREIARELNIGLDSLVFLDDNPVERARVRAELPEVLTPELPADPAQFRSVLLELGVFDTLALTEEDRQRQRVYAEQKDRRASETRMAAGGSVADYLASLNMVVELAPANSLTLPRIAQLTNKTNQFNLTTRRYGEAEIADRVAQGWVAIGARVTDRFGDNGLTGVVLARPDGDVWEIDTLLLSCRVMGRRVETALLAVVADEALRSGARRLTGWFLPTPKNAPSRDCYSTHGFHCVEARPDGGSRWELELPSSALEVPAWLTVRAPAMAVI
ncbi:MAG: HAD-IIIC family phosphatase [Chloroflexota bacterium]|nr:HAD-IIIC family phosphatase [Chloroflexota bacterium]